MRLVSRLISLCLFLPVLALGAQSPSQPGVKATAAIEVPATSVPVEGVDYATVSAPMPTDANTPKGNVQVTEFFSYGCPYCYHLDPTVEQWLKSKPANVSFNRIPVVFHPTWAVYAKAYYAAQALGVEDKVTPVLFNAIQNDKQPMTNQQDLEKVFVAQGVSKNDFESAFNFSPGVDAQIKRGQDLMQAYQIMAVPAFVVNNQYRTDLGMVKGDDKRLMQVLSYLVTKSQAGKNG